ncbi:MAG: hypothetical protein M3430_22030 [Acidobacteriota bacterium]|nr:hypothetical protein [Acidobacteriota bacterium]
MFGKTVMNFRAYWLMLLMVLTFASEALAGGFYLSVETPSTNNSQHKDAVLLVRPYGCHQPSDAALSATAEGVVNGERRSVPLRLTAVSEGAYAIRQEWPAEGAWVLAINGAYNGYNSGVLVRLGTNGKVEMKRPSTGNKNEVNAQTVPHKLTREEIENALAGSKTTNTARAAASPVGATKMGIGVGSGFGLAALSLLIWQGRRGKAE